MSRSVLWIKTVPITVDAEPKAIKASIVYFAAVHADMKSLREGITCVFGTVQP
jgi:hypothetical protein